MDRFRIATAFASDSNPSDLVSNVNDSDLLYGSASQPLTNWNRREEGSVGVLFEILEVLTKRQSKCTSRRSRVGAPKSYVIEYYVGKATPTAPKILAL